MQFGNILKRKREEYRMTQTDLAQRIGTTQQNINSYETGYKVPPLRVVVAAADGILRFGVPRAIYVDNGSEFLVSDIGGRGHRRKKDWNKDPLPPTILSFLDIEMHNAIVRNAKAKPRRGSLCQNMSCTILNIIPCWSWSLPMSSSES